MYVISIKWLSYFTIKLMNKSNGFMFNHLKFLPIHMHIYQYVYPSIYRYQTVKCSMGFILIQVGCTYAFYSTTVISKIKEMQQATLLSHKNIMKSDTHLSYLRNVKKSVSVKWNIKLQVNTCRFHICFRSIASVDHVIFILAF